MSAVNSGGSERNQNPKQCLTVGGVFDGFTRSVFNSIDLQERSSEPLPFQHFAIRMAQPHIHLELFPDKCGMEAKFSGLQRAPLRK